METRECAIIVDDQDLIWESTKETAEKNTKQMQLGIYIGLSMGRAGSVLDPTQTRLVGVGWKAEGLETDPRCQSVESVFGLGGV